MCTTLATNLSVSVFHIPIKLRIVPSRCIVAPGCVTIAQKGAMGTLLVDVEKRADSISSSNSGSMPESSMLSFSLVGNNRRSILKPRFSKGVVMSSGIAGTDMSDLDELSAHINNRVINGIDPGTNSKSHESPLAELVSVWKANMQSLERIKVSLRNTTADTVKSMPATDGLQTSEQYFISPRGITHSGGMPSSEILSLHAATATDADDDTTDNARDLHRNFPPPQLEKNKSFYARSTEESNASKPVLLHELIAQRKASTKSTPGSLTNMESASSAASLESSSPTRRATVIDAKTNLVPSPPTYYKRSLSFTSLSDRACSIAQREASTKSTPGSLTNMESASSAASLESSSPTRRTTAIDAKTNLVPSPQTYLRSLSFNTSLNGGACSPAASPRLSTGLKMTTLVKPDGPNIPLGDNNDSENAAAISSPRTSRATYRRSLSLTSLNGGACSPAASPRLSTVGLMKTMTLLVKPDGPNIPLAGNIDDSENAAETAISSPRTLRALSQRERRKSNVSKVSLAPDADLAPVTESHSSPRPGRNDDNKPPGIHKRTPVLSPDWQQPQDVLKMTLDESPDGNMLCNDSESASVSSPRNLHVAHVLQREHRKRSVSLKPVVRYGQAYYLTFEIPSDADLAPAVPYSSPRAGRNVDNEPEMYNRKPGLGQEWQQPQDLLAKAKVSPDLVVKLPDLDLSKKASVMGISSTNAANCAGPQRNFSLSRTGSNDELIMSQARLCR